MEKIKYLLVFILFFGFVLTSYGQKIANQTAQAKLLVNYFEETAFDRIADTLAKNPKAWAEVLDSSSKLQRLMLYRYIAMAYLHLGNTEKGREYARKIRKLYLFYEPVADDSEALKSLLRKIEKIPKLQIGIWAGANNSFLQTEGAPIYVFENWINLWERSKVYHGQITWQAGIQGEYYFGKYIGFFGGISYQKYSFDYHASQSYQVTFYDQSKSPINNTISTLSDQKVHYYVSQTGLTIHKNLDRLNMNLYIRQGLAWGVLLEATRTAQKDVGNGNVAVSTPTRTDGNFYRNNWIWLSKIGLRYHFRHFSFGVEANYLHHLSALSQIRYDHGGGFGLASDYYDFLDRVRLQNLQINLTALYTFHYRIR